MFFRNAFAVGGDKTAVPMDTQPSGSVSYQEGFGPDYSLDMKSDPDAIPVPRDQTNQILFDITTALQQYQTRSVPAFITDADGKGDPYSYKKYARAIFNPGAGERVYESLVDSNTATPADPTKWRWVNNNAAVVDTQNAAFDVSVVDFNAVYWNSVDSKFENAQADGSSAQEVVGIADVTNGRVLLVGLITGFTGLTPGAIYFLSPTTAGAITDTKPVGNAVRVGVAKNATDLFFNPAPEVADTGTPVGTSIDFRGFSAPAGFLLEDGSAINRTTYAALLNVITFTLNGDISNGSPIVTNLPNTTNVIPGAAVEGTGIPSGTTVLTVDSSTQVTLTQNATTTATATSLKFFPYGNGNGTTTFNVPDSRRTVSVGSGGTGTSTLGNKVGQSGGEETHTMLASELATHTHQYTKTDNPGSFLGTNTAALASAYAINTVDTGPAGSSTPFNVMQPSRVVTKAIKF